MKTKRAVMIPVVLSVLLSFSTVLVASNATGGTGGTCFILESGIARIIGKHIPDTKVPVESAAATIGNIRLVAAQKVQFVIVMPDGAYFGFHGGRGFKRSKYQNLLSVPADHVSPMHFTVRSNSGIESWADLKGKRIAVALPGSAARFLAESTLEDYRLTGKDYKSMFLSHAEQATALRDGTIDMSCIFAGSPPAAVVDLCMTHDIAFLDVGAAEMKKILTTHPYCTKFTIQAGTCKGQKKDVKTFAAPSSIITHAEMPERTVYDVTRTILEHTPELKEIHLSGAAFDLADVSWNLQFRSITDLPGTSWQKVF